jgi:hypothetical protein
MSQMHNYIIKAEFTIFLILLFQLGYPSINSSTERHGLLRKQLEEKGKQGKASWSTNWKPVVDAIHRNIRSKNLLPRQLEKTKGVFDSSHNLPSKNLAI